MGKLDLLNGREINLSSTLQYIKEKLSQKIFAEVVCLSENGEFLATAHFRHSDKSGVVQVFRNLQDTWVSVGEIFGGYVEGLHFGNALAFSCDGRTLAIAGDGDAIVSGVVTVYSFSSSSMWEKKGQLLNGTPGTFFGSSVALSSDGHILAIGQRKKKKGVVHVFQYENNTWIRMGEVISDKLAGDDFGISVVLANSGDTLAVGANSFDSDKEGTASIFTFIDNKWCKKGETIKGEIFSHFGTAIGLCGAGNLVVIGSPSFKDGTGKIETYHFCKNRWERLGNAIHGAHANAFFGNALDLSKDGKTLLVASDGYTCTYGALMLYLFDGHTWKESGENLVGDTVGGYFGLSVSLCVDKQKIASANLKILNDGVVYRYSYLKDITY